MVATVEAAVGLAIAAALGWALLPRGSAPGAHASIATEAPLALVVGLTVAVPSVLVTGRLGMPAAWAALTPVALAALALAVRLATRRPAAVRASTGEPPASAVERAAGVVLLASLGLFAARVLLAPLWSWDHFAIWGAKARRIAAAGRLDGPFLAGDGLSFGGEGYPLGFPVALLATALGGVPEEATFKALHLAAGVALALLVRQVALAAGAARAAATTAAALVAASPLYWDTESLGLADLPLALWAVAGLLLLLRSQRAGASAGPCTAVTAGLVIGLLPWLKDEGLPLAIFLLLAGSALASGRGTAARRRWTVEVVLPAAGMIAASWRLARPPGGAGFFAGDWAGRVAARLGEAGELARLLAVDLLRPSWLGFWILFAAGLVAAAVLGRRTPLLLAAPVAAQLAVYAFVYLATYLDPAAHVYSSFFRIAAAQVPLAAVALATLLPAVPDVPGEGGARR